jgi:hypothetical protein
MGMRNCILITKGFVDGNKKLCHQKAHNSFFKTQLKKMTAVLLYSRVSSDLISGIAGILFL